MFKRFLSTASTYGRWPLALLLAALLSACASMPHSIGEESHKHASAPAPAPVAEISQAQEADQLLAQGKDLAAAKAYIEAAAASGTDKQLDYLSKAAQASLAGNRPQVAELLSAEVLRLSQEPAQRAEALWIQAQAYERDGQTKLARGALASLIAIDTVSPERRAEAMGRLAKIYEAENHDLTALDFLIKRDALLTGVAKAENRRRIHALLDAQNSAKLRNWRGRSGDPVVQEWLAFALIAREHVEPANRQAAFAAWLQAHPGHPDIHYDDASASNRAAGLARGAICTLLPTSGRFASDTTAFVAGLQAAAQQEAGPAIYQLSDSSDPALNATEYAAGVQAGCAAFVGPALPQDSNAVLGARHPSNPPILLLGAAQPHSQPGVYDFDISLRVTARQVAEDALRAGYRQAAVLYPLDAEGADMQAAFLEAWKKGGGSVVGVAHYRDGDTASAVQQALGVAPLGTKTFVFLVAPAQRLADIIGTIRAQTTQPILLAGIPTFAAEQSTSISDARVYALGSPWVFDPQIAGGPVAQAVRQSLPQASAAQWRMAGLGAEAYGLVAKILHIAKPAGASPTGALSDPHTLQENNKRDLRWVRWQNGNIEVLPALPEP